jgi:ribonuclease HII
MAYLIGTDEAGYGPNLGPLVIAASVWRVPNKLVGADLYDALGAGIARPGDENADGRVLVGDSKLLYQSQQGQGTLGNLERAVLSALALLKRPVRGWREVWAALDGAGSELCDGEPCLCDFQQSVPVDAKRGELRSAVARLRSTLRTARIQLVDLRAVAIMPSRFNELVEIAGNKATALSQITLGLLERAMTPIDAGPIDVICDKHGGRNHYLPLLQQQFPEWLVEVVRQGQAESRYRWGPPKRRVGVRFCVNGDSQLPAALASMAAKYLRELIMRAFNAFWSQHIPGIRPTAGYFGDARRFKDEIEPAQRKLGIADRQLWRCC